MKINLMVVLARAPTVFTKTDSLATPLVPVQMTTTPIVSGLPTTALSKSKFRIFFENPIHLILLANFTVQLLAQQKRRA